MTTAGAEPTERLAPEHPFRVLRRPLGFYVERIRSRSWFSYAKLNHGYWEAELALRARPPEPGEAAARRVDRENGWPFFVEGGFRDELIAMLGELPTDDPDFVFATSHVGYPGSDRIEGVTADPRALIDLMQSVLPAGLVPDDGSLFKAATISGEIRTLWDAIRPLEVVVVGPEWLAALRELLALPRFTLVAIPPRDARGRREAILARLEALHARLDGRPAAWLFQAGSLAPWLIRKLHGSVRNTFLLDVGRPLDVCRPEIVFRHNWGRVYRRELRDHLGLVDPRVRDTRRVFAADGPGRPAERLEAALADHLGLPEGRRVVLCRSRAEGLDALAERAAERAGRPLRWVMAALAHPSTRRGALADARIVDCEPGGLPDPAALEALDPAAWDGLVATSRCGLVAGWEAHAALAGRLGKRLLADGGVAMDAPYRRREDAPDEAVGFARDLPWCDVDGGFVLVGAEEADALRRRLEPIAAETADRLLRCLRDLDVLSVRLHLQYQRITRFAAEAGHGVLGPDRTLEKLATPAAAHLVLPAARLDPAALVDAPFRRGPAPLDPGCPVAADLHERLIEVPCRRELEAWTNAELIRALERPLREPARPGPEAVHPGDRPRPTA